MCTNQDWAKEAETAWKMKESRKDWSPTFLSGKCSRSKLFGTITLTLAFQACALRLVWSGKWELKTLSNNNTVNYSWNNGSGYFFSYTTLVRSFLQPKRWHQSSLFLIYRHTSFHCPLQILHFLQNEALWQPCIKVYQHHFSNSIHSLCLCVTFW